MSPAQDPCHRFEEEGLLLEERGDALPVHFSTCPDCRAARRAYGELRASLGALGQGEEPAEGWQARVQARIQARQGGSSKPSSPAGTAPLGGPSRFRRWLLPAGLAAAALFLLTLLPERIGTPWRPLPSQPSFVATVIPGPVVFRGAGEAKPGDSLEIRAAFRPGEPLEVRVYRGERALIARCASLPRPQGPAAATPGCTPLSGAVHLTVPLDTVGRYQAVLLFSTTPLPEPGAGLDADTAAALAAGAQIKVGDEILVR